MTSIQKKHSGMKAVALLVALLGLVASAHGSCYDAYVHCAGDFGTAELPKVMKYKGAEEWCGRLNWTPLTWTPPSTTTTTITTEKPDKERPPNIDDKPNTETKEGDETPRENSNPRITDEIIESIMPNMNIPDMDMEDLTWPTLLSDEDSGQNNNKDSGASEKTSFNGIWECVRHTLPATKKALLWDICWAQDATAAVPTTSLARLRTILRFDTFVCRLLLDEMPDDDCLAFALKLIPARQPTPSSQRLSDCVHVPGKVDTAACLKPCRTIVPVELAKGSNEGQYDKPGSGGRLVSALSLACFATAAFSHISFHRS